MPELVNPAYLMREDAPFDEKVWEILDAAMLKTAKRQLVGRRLLPIEGPFGLGIKAIPLDDTEIEAGLMTSAMLPLLMIRKPFTLSVRDVANYESAHLLLNTQPLEEAALACAALEDRIVFQGAAGVPGLLNAPGVNALKLLAWDEVGTAAGAVIQAVTLLDKAGFHGPYSMALTPQRYNLLFRRYPQGNQSELAHIQSIVTKGIFKAHNLQDGGLLLAADAQSASIVVGQDMRIGFVGPEGDKFAFFVSESLALRIRYPQAICVLKGE